MYVEAFTAIKTKILELMLQVKNFYADKLILSLQAYFFSISAPENGVYVSQPGKHGQMGPICAESGIMPKKDQYGSDIGTLAYMGPT